MTYALCVIVFSLIIFPVLTMTIGLDWLDPLSVETVINVKDVYLNGYTEQSES